MKTLWIASDHAGFDLKTEVIQQLKNLTDFNDYQIIDLGPNSKDSVDYADYANLVCRNLNIKKSETNSELENFGVLICGSGQGMALRANKFTYIRAALVYNDEIAQLAREHNDANVICLGARFCSLSQATKWIQIFKSTHFAGGRHQTRVAKITQPTT